VGVLSIINNNRCYENLLLKKRFATNHQNSQHNPGTILVTLLYASAPADKADAKGETK
jgi:hypothetical protein